MTQLMLNTSRSVMVAMFFTTYAYAYDPLPAGLDKAIANPNIPSILDVTILKFNKAGHGEIKVNATYKPGPAIDGKKWMPPNVVRGYGYTGTDKIAPLRVVTGGQAKRFLVFLDGDLLYSTYNNRFPIREAKNGVLEVAIGFNGGGAPWLPLKDIVKRIPKAEASQLEAKTGRIKRQYVKGAVLSKTEEKTVLEIAERRGIEKAAKIYTYNLYLTAARGIGVEGTEQVKGREVSRKVLHVRFKKWWHPNQAPKKGDLQIGEFWAGQPSTQKQTILKVAKEEFRTGTIQGLSIEDCESIIGRLLAQKYVVGPNVNEQSIQQIDWSKPQAFRKRGDAISVSFLHKRAGGGFFDLQLKLDNDQLSITESLQAVP